MVRRAAIPCRNATRSRWILSPHGKSSVIARTALLTAIRPRSAVWCLNASNNVCSGKCKVQSYSGDRLTVSPEAQFTSHCPRPGLLIALPLAPSRLPHLVSHHLFPAPAPHWLPEWPGTPPARFSNHPISPYYRLDETGCLDTPSIVALIEFEGNEAAMLEALGTAGVEDMSG